MGSQKVGHDLATEKQQQPSEREGWTYGPYSLILILCSLP